MKFEIFGFILLSYLFGSIPFGYLIVKAKKGTDIRKIGSGATGGTNVGRVLGRKWGIFVGVLDISKAAFPVFLSTKFLPKEPFWPLALVISGAVLGHIYPVFLNFKGGKGISTTIGGLFPIFPWQTFLLIILTILPLIWFTKISSVGSLNFALFLPIFLYLFGKTLDHLFLGIFLLLIIFWAHRENIQRLIEGKEKKSGLF